MEEKKKLWTGDLVKFKWFEQVKLNSQTRRSIKVANFLPLQECLLVFLHKINIIENFFLIKYSCGILLQWELVASGG